MNKHMIGPMNQNKAREGETTSEQVIYTMKVLALQVCTCLRPSIRASAPQGEEQTITGL